MSDDAESTTTPGSDATTGQHSPSRKDRFLGTDNEGRVLEYPHQVTDASDGSSWGRSPRPPFRRDRDRILYTRHFRRLKDVTQVARAGESYLYHDRLSHSLKVAQVGRSLAELLLERQDRIQDADEKLLQLVKQQSGDALVVSKLPDLATRLDPNVVETACMAHDMGHPPFGHRVEETLDELVREYHDGLPDADDDTPGAETEETAEAGDGAAEEATAPDERGDVATDEDEDEASDVPGPYFGFEGNAQSLRIVTKLSQSGLESINLTALERSAEFELNFDEDDVEGLHLTRATLNALIKYPWSPEHRDDKYGYYPRTEHACFEFARQLGPADCEQTLEAQVMDYADDVTYAIHDMTDFYQDGRLPLHVLLNEGYEIRSRIDDADDPELEFDCYDPDPETRDDRLPNTPELDRFAEYIGGLPADKQELDEAILPDSGEIARTFAKLAQTWPEAIGQHSLTVFRGSPDERRVLDRFTSDLINRYLDASEQYQPTVAVRQREGDDGGYRLEKEDEIEREVWLLRKLTEFYVLRDSALMGQQRGEEAVIRELYHALYSELVNNDGDLGFSAISEPFSTWLEDWQRPKTMATDEIYWARITADIIATLTEQQALQLYGRLTGQTPGSLQDRIIK